MTSRGVAKLAHIGWDGCCLCHEDGGGGGELKGATSSLAALGRKGQWQVLIGPKLHPKHQLRFRRRWRFVSDRQVRAQVGRASGPGPGPAVCQSSPRPPYLLPFRKSPVARQRKRPFVSDPRLGSAHFKSRDGGRRHRHTSSFDPYGVRTVGRPSS